MSKVVTPPMARPTTPSTTSTTTVQVPREKVAMRAYEKWCLRGCPPGTDMQDWLEAECELRTELTKGMSCSTSARR